MRGAETVKGNKSRKNYLPSGGSSFSDRAVPEQNGRLAHRLGCSPSRPTGVK